MSEAEWHQMQKRRQITLSQAEALERQFPQAQAIAPITTTGQMVKYNKRSGGGVTIIGTTEQYQFTGGFSIAQGRFISPAESDGGRPVCVVGAGVATNLFQREPPLGKQITVGQQPFEVIGVLEKQGGMFGTQLDNQVIIPLAALYGEFRNTRDVDQIQVKVKDTSDLDEAREELRSVFRRIRGLAPTEPDDFGVNQQEQILNVIHRVTGMIAAVGLFITGLSLFVGGIGIMNIMFVSVAERTREIGIRKAIGAKRRTILLQFLIEAAAICLIGGAIGLGIAWPFTLLIQRFLPATLSPMIVGIALLVSLITGVLSGIFPAWRAARMNPVDALRNE